MLSAFLPLNPHWEGKAWQVKPRGISLTYTPGKINVILGLRRSGKTHLIYQEINKLVQEGIPRERILYLSFFHIRLTPYQKGERLYQLLTEFIHEDSSPAYIFLDEIQEVQEWERVVESLREEAFITLTGSTSTLLSGHIGRKLVGRTQQYHVHPLSLREYEAWTGKTCTVESLPEGYAKSALPEYVLYGKDEHIIQTYQDILSRDVYPRATAADHPLIEDLAYTLLNTFASTFTTSSLSRQTGIPYAKVRQLVSLLTESYLFTILPTYTHKPGLYLRAPRKAYPADTGFVRLLKQQTTRDWGRIIELLIHTSIQRVLRQDEQAYRYQTKQQYEVDFYVTRQQKPYALIQVTASDTPPAREERALIHAVEETRAKAYLITPRTRAKRTIQWHGKKADVHYVPLIDWLRDSRKELDA